MIMKKVAIVFWSGTGNTETMANAVAEGAKNADAEITLIQAADFGPERVAEFDAIAFGCPAMGAEVLEEDEFQPMFDACGEHLRDKTIALFGSYGWGDGEWMENWEQDCRAKGAVLACDSVTCQEAPDDEGENACKALGAALAE